jgi:hypothetical protein
MASIVLARSTQQIMLVKIKSENKNRCTAVPNLDFLHQQMALIVVYQMVYANKKINKQQMIHINRTLQFDPKVHRCEDFQWSTLPNDLLSSTFEEMCEVESGEMLYTQQTLTMLNIILALYN